MNKGDWIQKVGGPWRRERHPRWRATSDNGVLAWLGTSQYRGLGASCSNWRQSRPSTFCGGRPRRGEVVHSARLSTIQSRQQTWNRQ